MEMQKYNTPAVERVRPPEGCGRAGRLANISSAADINLGRRHSFNSIHQSISFIVTFFVQFPISEKYTFYENYK